MSRFFRATRAIIGRYYKPTICMVSAVSFTSFPILPTVSAESTKPDQNPLTIDIIEPTDKPMYKPTKPTGDDKMGKILQNVYNEIQDIKKKPPQDPSELLLYAVKFIPIAIEIYQIGLGPALTLMDHFVPLANDATLEQLQAEIGVEMVEKLHALRLAHKKLVTAGVEAMKLSVNQYRDQKSNLNNVLSLIEKIESKSKSDDCALSKSDKDALSDCMTDLSEFVEQKVLAEFFEKCDKFQSDVKSFKKEIDEINSTESRNKVIRMLTYAGLLSVSGLGAVLEYTRALDAIVGAAYSKYITRSMMVVGAGTTVGTYLFAPTTFSFSVLKEVKVISSELSSLIDYYHILQDNESESTVNTQSVESHARKLVKRKSLMGMKSGLLRVVEYVEKYEKNGETVVKIMVEMRKSI